jgi:hypothetical protein
MESIMTSLQERRLRALRNRLQKAAERKEAAWREAKKADTRVNNLIKKITRYERLLSQEPKPASHPDFYPPHLGGKPQAYTMPVQEVVNQLNKEEAKREERREVLRTQIATDPDKLEIPGFLARSPAALPPEQLQEALAKEAKLAEQKVENQKVKVQVRKQVKEAKLRGQLKKMPLTGKAALDFIKNGA